jgi:hypothetical protein
MSKSKFDFVKEVYLRSEEREYDFVEELRYVEISRFMADFKEGITDWVNECFLNNYMQYISLKNDLFLQKMIDIYDEDELKQYLDDCPSCKCHLYKEHNKTCKLNDKNTIWNGIKDFEKNN